jgi:hypothetical protein
MDADCDTGCCLVHAISRIGMIISENTIRFILFRVLWLKVYSVGGEAAV